MKSNEVEVSMAISEPKLLYQGFELAEIHIYNTVCITDGKLMQ